MSTGELRRSESEGHKDDRAVWERPAVRRMAANEAQTGFKSNRTDKTSHNAS
jgi:hypothetical protein